MFFIYIFILVAVIIVNKHTTTEIIIFIPLPPVTGNIYALSFFIVILISKFSWLSPFDIKLIFVSISDPMYSPIGVPSSPLTILPCCCHSFYNRYFLSHISCFIFSIIAIRFLCFSTIYSIVISFSTFYSICNTETAYLSNHMIYRYVKKMKFKERPQISYLTNYYTLL